MNAEAAIVNYYNTVYQKSEVYSALLLHSYDLNITSQNVSPLHFKTQDSTLGGHVDDAEEDMTAPIVSISLGSCLPSIGGLIPTFCSTMTR